MSKLETDIFNYNSTEFFRNLDLTEINKIPKNHKDYIALRDAEKDKCINGVNVNGVFIWGSLYYILNHHKIEMDVLDNKGNERRLVSLPDLRDNEWIIHEELNKAQGAREGFCLGSARQIGKTETIVGLTMRELFLFQNTEAVGVFTTKPDKQTFAKKAQVAIQHGSDLLVVPCIDKDWTKEYFRFGVTQRDNEPFIWSKLYLYLNNRGNNTEVAAGKTISWYFMDEIAKENMVETWEAAKPALRGKYGYRCSPIFAFTGGNIEKSLDAESLYFNPESNNIRKYNHAGKDTGFFMSSDYRMDFKETDSFLDFYSRRYKTLISEPCQELKDLTIEVSNFKRATSTLDGEEKKAQENSLTVYQKQKMYNPRKVADMFIKLEQNPFVHLTDELQAHREDLVANPRHRNYEISNDKLVFSGKKNLDHYPLSERDKVELHLTGISITELPLNEFEEKTHVAGADPFNTLKTATSASLGAWFIMKKQTVDYTDPYGDCIVAWYNGRNSIKPFRDQMLFLLEAYGSTLLHEAADDNTTQWFIEQDKGFLLENTYTLNRQINPKSKALNAKGLRPTLNTQSFYIELMVQYCEDILPDGKRGLTRIPDPYLIDQMLMFDGDLAPMDALVAFGHVLMHLHKDKKRIPRKWNYDTEETEEKKNKVTDIFGLDKSTRGGLI